MLKILEKIREKLNNGGNSFYGMFGICGILCMLMLALTAVANNIAYTTRSALIPVLDTETTAVQQLNLPPECLIIYQDDIMGERGLSSMSEILSQMKIPYKEIECGEAHSAELSDYGKIILSVTGYQHIGSIIGELKEWVKAGGDLMILYPPEISGSFKSLFDILGIRDCGQSYAYVETLKFSEGFLLGGSSRDFRITDAFESSMSVALEDDCQVFVKTADKYPTPIIWRRNVGLGTVVVDNFGMFEKGYRGIHSAAYSLLGDACIYPVINGSTFYIDDFPSPIPSGYSEYIQRDYNISVKDFYTSKWWTDTYNLANRYGFKYTGLVIEQYSDQVSGTFKRNTETERYLYFGNMLLDQGGEIGLHGYNHMPLVLENFSYYGLFDSYRQWASYRDMKNSIQELNSFCGHLFPNIKFQVYVPPSNIISKEGIAMLNDSLPDLKTIASVYLPGDLAYCQEFCVEENGLISTPRVISGYILDDYTRLVALCELNFHLVNTHFQHPDDVMDEDRGAALGWKRMFENLSDYVDWLYTAVPEIRSLTGSEIAAAVQRYDYIQPEQTVTRDGIVMELTNFYDEAWFMLRLNEGQTITGIDGGELTQLDNTLYLVRADSAHIELRLS